jgi:Beta-glucanase/Beta-glucan synthetase
MGGKKLHICTIDTKGKGDWQYGKIEVRARLPKGLGTWPLSGCWPALPHFRWPDDGEIDIMEHVGFNQGLFMASIHCKKYYHVIGTQKTDT